MSAPTITLDAQQLVEAVTRSLVACLPAVPSAVRAATQIVLSFHG